MGPASVCLNRKRSRTESFVSWSRLRLWSEKVYWGGGTSYNHLVQGQDCLEDARKLPVSSVRVMHAYVLHSSPCILVLPSLNNRHHFLTLLLFIASSLYTFTICRWVFAGRKFVEFKNHIIDCTSRLEQFQIFAFIFHNYSELVRGQRGGLWHRATQCTCAPWQTEDTWTTQKVRASPAGLLFAIGSYFWIVTCVCAHVCVCVYMKFQSFFYLSNLCSALRNVNN